MFGFIFKETLDLPTIFPGIQPFDCQQDQKFSGPLYNSEVGGRSHPPLHVGMGLQASPTSPGSQGPIKVALRANLLAHPHIVLKLKAGGGVIHAEQVKAVVRERALLTLSFWKFNPPISELCMVGRKGLQMPTR